jgi:2-polyprenyl-3-methyl-5-hydroxy-6-metoxy-1,4-benzoquinol methylase
MNSTLSILELYNSQVDWYEKNRNPKLMEKKYLDHVINLIPKNGSILDVGCGIGIPIGKYFSDQGFKITGVDGAEKMILRARALNPNIPFITADMRTLNLSEKFDALLAWNSFFHLTQDEQRLMFSIFKNHLKPGGVLLFTSGPYESIAIGEMNGHELFHSSLSSEEYRKILSENHFAVIEHNVEDPECGRHTVWLAKLN